MARTVSIIGAGRVGRTLGKRLRDLGWRVGAVVTRSPSTARASVRVIGAGTPLALPIAARPSGSARKGTALAVPKRPIPSGALAPEVKTVSAILAADVILFGTPDDLLPGVVREVARSGGSKCRGKIFLHSSATLDRSVLAPLARLGASTGSLHPMQAFGGTVVPELRGIVFAIEGDSKARRMARSIAKSFGGIPVEIRTRDKPIYHAAAVMAAGNAYPVVEAGLQMLIRIGFTRSQAMQTLLPLIRQILDNIGRLGPRAAWTGPLSRGDYEIVAKHARALRRYPREFQQAYAALSLLAGRLLSKNPATALKQIERALKKT